MVMHSAGPIIRNPNRSADSVAILLGTDADIVIVHNPDTLAANTSLTLQSISVLVGTPVTPVALAANSTYISNITASGDILLAVNNGGNSFMAFMADASTGNTLLGAISGSSVDVYVAGTKVLDIAANLALYSAAASTANQVLTVTNTSNAAAASHAYIEVSVGGTTSTGDPHIRWTIPSGTSWIAGPDNNDGDRFSIGTGTTLGSNVMFLLNGQTSSSSSYNDINLQPLATTLSGSTAAAVVTGASVESRTVTLSTTTQRTALQRMFNIGAATYAQSGGAVTVDKATGLAAVSVTAGASVTLTHSSAFRALTGGAAVNVSGILLEKQTAGTTNNFQVLMETGGTEPASLADYIGLYAVDVGAAAVLGIASETAVVTPAGDFALTSKLIVRVNGVSYAIGMTTTLT